MRMEIEMRLEEADGDVKTETRWKKELQVSRESLQTKYSQAVDGDGNGGSRKCTAVRRVLLAGCFGRRKKRVERKRKDWAVAAGSVAKYNPNHHPPKQ
jgi:hypothetical protein